MLEKTSGRKEKILTGRGAGRSVSNPKSNDFGNKQTIKKWQYTVKKILGRGTFGMVYLATLNSSGVQVAIKKVLQDDNYKNREHEIIKQMNHPNVVKLHHSYLMRQMDPKSPQSQVVFLYLIMEYIPEDLHRITRYFHQNSRFPNILIKAYSFQILRALSYFQINNVCHRDIKPRNILIDLSSHSLRICDFGSAKKLVKGQSNLSYVCSRYYRAPELQLGNQFYTVKSDIWSVGCVIGEMVLGQPLFLSDSSVDHMVTIIQKLGTPSSIQMQSLNPNIQQFYQKIPKIKAKSWKYILPKCDPLLRDLISKLLVYIPSKRLSPIQAMLHPYFSQLKDAKINGKRLSYLFNFTEAQKSTYKELSTFH